MTGETTGKTREFHYASRRIGLFVLLALAVFIAAILQAGVLRGLLNPTATLRVIMQPRGWRVWRAAPLSRCWAPGPARCGRS